MPKRPKMPDWMGTHIVETYQRLEEETGNKPTGPEVHRRIVEAQSKRTRPVPIPSLRYVQLALTQARPRIEIERDPDRPWNLGISAKHGISPEATQDLLDIKMWCVKIGRTFTIREAIWAARLRVVMPEKGTVWGLYKWAYRYALRERASTALDLPSTDTSDLDDELLRLTPWERETARAVGRLRERSSTWKDTEVLKEEPWYGTPEPALDAVDDLGLARHNRTLERGVLDLSSEANAVYAMWLKHISQGPQWVNLTDGQRDDIAGRLLKWVAGLEEEIKEYRGAHPGPHLFVPTSAPTYQARPFDVLEEVGYPIQQEATHKD